MLPKNSLSNLILNQLYEIILPCVQLKWTQLYYELLC